MVVKIIIAKKSIIEPNLHLKHIRVISAIHIHKWILSKVPIDNCYVTCLLQENTDLNWTQNSKIKLNILSPSILNFFTVPIRNALEAVPGAGPGLASKVQYILRFQYIKVSTCKVKSQQTFLTAITWLQNKHLYFYFIFTRVLIEKGVCLFNLKKNKLN